MTTTTIAHDDGMISHDLQKLNDRQRASLFNYSTFADDAILEVYVSDHNAATVTTSSFVYYIKFNMLNVDTFTRIRKPSNYECITHFMQLVTRKTK